MAVLISGRGSNMAAITRECQARRIEAEVAVVIADRPEAGGLIRAREMGVETRVVSASQAHDRAAFERALGACIAEYATGLIALAGFMRILSPEFVLAHLGRMLNIHPSLLPRHRGLHTHRRVLEAREPSHGASVHFVTPELDAGPVILQSRVPVEPGDTEATLAARVLTTELVIYPRVIGWFADRRLSWDQGHAVFDGKPLQSPIVEDMHALVHG